MSAGSAISGVLTGLTFGALTGGQRIFPTTFGYNSYSYGSLDVNNMYLNPLNSNCDARESFFLSNPIGYNPFGSVFGLSALSMGGYLGASPAFMSGYIMGRTPFGWYC